MKWIIELNVPDEATAAKYMKVMAEGFQIAADHGLPVDHTALLDTDIKVTCKKIK